MIAYTLPVAGIMLPSRLVPVRGVPRIARCGGQGLPCLHPFGRPIRLLPTKVMGRLHAAAAYHPSDDAAEAVRGDAASLLHPPQRARQLSSDLLTLQPSLQKVRGHRAD